MIGILEVQREDDVKKGVENNCSVRKRGVYDDGHNMRRARKIHGVNGTFNECQK